MISNVATLVDLACQRSLQSPDQYAYTFLVDGEIEAAKLTYAELDRQARAIAVQLIEMGASGKRALLLYPPGLEYVAAFFGCLYAGVIAVPAYPPGPRSPGTNSTSPERDYFQRSPTGGTQHIADCRTRHEADAAG